VESRPTMTPRGLDRWSWMGVAAPSRALAGRMGSGSSDFWVVRGIINIWEFIRHLPHPLGSPSSTLGGPIDNSMRLFHLKARAWALPAHPCCGERTRRSGWSWRFAEDNRRGGTAAGRSCGKRITDVMPADFRKADCGGCASDSGRSGHRNIRIHISGRGRRPLV